MTTADEPLAFGDFLFHPAARTLLLNGTPVTLGGPARSLLAALLAQPGEVVGAAALMESAWPGGARGEANLRVQMTALRKALAAVPEGQGAILNIPGRGYQFTLPVRRLSAPPLVAGLPDEESGRPPPLLTRLIGRERELALLAERLEDRRLITLAGIGGIGKTSLALAAAGDWAARHGRRLRFLDLTALSDPALLPAAAGGALGLGTPGLDPVEEIGATLRGETMLILDSAEHLAEAAARLAERLLKRSPALRLLVTSREPLGAAGEWLHRLAPLEVPPETEPRDAAEVMAYPAAQLFVERASARLGGFSPKDSDAAGLALLCRKLDGLPLAIALAASRIDMFGIAGLAAGMADQLAAPGSSRRSTPGRHRTMRATLDWSHDALSPADQRLLRRLSVFRGPFSVTSAVTVTGEDVSIDAGRALVRLETKSLLHRVEGEGDGGPLRRLLATTRAYAAEKLEASGEAPALHRLHALHVLERVGAAEAMRPGMSPSAWRTAHAGLADDLRAAVDWAFGPEGEVEIGLSLLAGSGPLWLGLNLAAEYRHRLELALSRLTASGQGETLAALRLHVAAGMTILRNTGEVALVAEPLRRAIEIADRIGEGGAAIRAVGGLWMACIMAGDTAGAVRLSAEMDARIPPGTPPDSDLRQAHHRVAALTLHYAGDQREARRHADLAMHHLRARLDTSPYGLMIDQAAAVHVLDARLLWLDGRFDAARAAAGAALAAAEAAEDALSLCYALTQAGVPIAVWTGDPAAPERVEQLAATALRHRMPYWHGWARLFGSLSVRPGEVPSLPRELELTPYHLEVVATMNPALADSATIARAEAGQAAWCAPELLRAKAENLLRRAGGEPGAARAAERVLREALALAERGALRAWALRSATSLARLWRGQGEHGRAEDLLTPLLTTFDEGRDMPDLMAARKALEAA
ncbi:ATP-binding protein [Pararoseomonas indoligenes]|uniref:Winged helix-turn-helix domain-containing protein n=1 Tax=Roseomonas indoligenes TaxID=2820811 RepID=A0A940N1L8_9PROT|nr:winged helix-turn-helix domain-containing protein [Pararoseomonas indoligenes]MBP0495107.1 winged helix-turn-helix domain-containing protein [Pararoseomonas indoligenes]